MKLRWASGPTRLERWLGRQLEPRPALRAFIHDPAKPGHAGPRLGAI